MGDAALPLRATGEPRQAGDGQVVGPGHLQRVGHGHLPRRRPTSGDHVLRLALLPPQRLQRPAGGIGYVGDPRCRRVPDSLPPEHRVDRTGPGTAAAPLRGGAWDHRRLPHRLGGPRQRTGGARYRRDPPSALLDALDPAIRRRRRTDPSRPRRPGGRHRGCPRGWLPAPRAAGPRRVTTRQTATGFWRLAECRCPAS